MQIYRRSDEQFEVYTTVFSPQVCRSRTRRGQVETETVVVAVVQYRSRLAKGLDLNQGDLIQVLFKRDETWWFGRLTNGDQGYFPVACVEPLQCSDSPKATPTPGRRGSTPTDAPCGCSSSRSTPKLLRKNSVQQPSGHVGPSSVMAGGSGGAAAPCHGSPSLLNRVLTKSRRKSCPLLLRPRVDAGAVNSAFQPD